MDPMAHWDRVYDTKTPDAVSWYRPHLKTSLALIDSAAGGPFASVTGAGAGESILVDDLLTARIPEHHSS
jgi:hypothetical protein